MNTYGWILLTALVVVTFLEVGVGLLSLLRAPQSIPEFFQDSITQEEYSKSQAYVAAQTRLDIFSHIYNLSLLLAFWMLSGFPMLDQWVKGVVEGELVQGLVFLFALTALNYLFNLPLELYRTFILEEKFGLNRTTWKTYLADMAKGMGLVMVLGIPLLAAILTFFNWAGELAWLACWLFSVGMISLLQYVSPRWILPLFLKFSPLEEGALRQAILGYAGKINFPVGEISVVDGSRRSSKANAFFSGFGKNRRIALFDTLVEKLTPDEMVGVVAHEVGHDRHKHLIKGMMTAMIHMGVMFWLLSLFLTQQGFFQAFFVEQPSIYVGLALFSLFFAPLDLLISLLFKAISRHYEREADRFAITSTGKPLALANALKKLAITNLSQLTPHPWQVILHYSHPPVGERIGLILAKPANE
ncbi:MAG: M48 family metallopeptidase [Magnetococcales bacterium]|nr:M48 family metallopeptidase [Magnetococcales bacterium]NGZ27442.1 M48 family metallopeptidase [Magnetococcales bacterium]